MERKPRKCSICNEWFTTTSAIMAAHYREKHEAPFRKAAEVASLTVKKAMFEVQARFAPWPECITYIAAAAMTEAQINKVIAA